MIPARTLAAVALFVVALGLALPLRFAGLEARPMHTDEAVHGMKLGALLETGRWEYDPYEYHGPTLPYSGLLAARISGDESTVDLSRTTLRATVAVYGILLILLLVLVADGIGLLGIGIAALLTAVSPMLVYYSRYFIMEIPFVVFTFGIMACGWRYFLSRRAGWAVAAGAFAGLTFATKETCIITFFALACAGAATYLIDHFAQGDRMVIDRRRRPPWRPAHLVAAAGTALLVGATLFTSFFTHWRGLVDSILTYQVYFSRAGGGGHEHPWGYYLKLLVGGKDGGFVWPEAVVLVLAAVGLVAAFASRQGRGRPLHFVRFVAIYSLVTLVVYSSLSYKTPWTILSFFHGAVILAGFGAAWLLTGIRSKVARVGLAALMVAGVWHLARQSYYGNFRFFAHERNPYVYAHTAPDFENVVKRIRQLEALKPAGEDPLTIQVAHPEFGWPLPWSLRGFPTVGFQQEIPEGVASADIIVLEAGEAVGFAPTVAESHVKDGPYGLRPDSLLTLFIRRELWDTFIELQSRKSGS
ncbi:hypothetical protein BH23VER1_BH23VER1_33310 [soil metagenome]